MTNEVIKQMIVLLDSTIEGVSVAETEEVKENATAVLCDCYNAIKAIEQAIAGGFDRDKTIYYLEMTEALKLMLEAINDSIQNSEDYYETKDKYADLISLMKKELVKEVAVQV